MQEPNNEDKFHAWVRQTLGEYRPDRRPGDWQRMQRALRRRQWWRLGVLGLVCVLAGLLAGKWLADTQTPVAPRITAAPVTPPPAPSATELKPEPEPDTASAPASPEPERGARDTDAGRTANRSAGRTYAPTPSFARPAFPAVTPLEPQPELSPLRKTAAPWAPPLRLPSPEEGAIVRQMRTGTFGPDSTAYRVLARNLRRWPNAVIVCDLTTSMYPYSTQLFAWFRKNVKHAPVQGIVFFTDCDSLGRETRPGGPPGLMFVTRPGDVSAALPVMLAAARNTVANADAAENDVEALLFARTRFPKARHLVLLADNGSPVKDMARLENVDLPVHVVLCGTPRDSALAFQPDYYAMARRTGGSLHTLEDDLAPGKISGGTWIKAGPRYYRYQPRRDRFKVTRFRHRPRRFLGLFWY